MELQLWQWCVFGFGLFFSGFVQSSLGFGYALVAMAILPFLVGVKDANLIVSFSAFAPLAVGAWSFRKDLQRESLKVTVLFALLALPVGLAVLVYSLDSWLMKGTGLVILLLVLDSIFRKPTVRDEGISPTPKPAWWWAAIAGAASGFLTGSVTIGGPPVVVYATYQPWTPRQIRAFLNTFLLIGSIAKLISLTATDLISTDILILSAIAIPLGWCGGQLGVRMAGRIHAEMFRRLTLVMLIVIALLMIAKS